jgi:hypothetical protein
MQGRHKRGRFRGALILLALSALGTAGLAAYRLTPQEPPPVAQALRAALAPTRSIEARLSWAVADGYRPYEAARAGTRPESFPLELLARLEKTGDLQGLAATSLLLGASGQAAAYLAQSGDSPELNCDRAVLALQREDAAEALSLLEGVLRQNPRHAPALWNRGLVLRDMQLWLLAAEAFEAVAALGEEGWAAEARSRAEALRSRAREEEASWNEAKMACSALVNGTRAALPEELLRQRPGLFRACFYDALAAVKTPARLEALGAVARTLDAHSGNSLLQKAADRTRARDLRRRAPLAEFYLHIFNNRDSRDQWSSGVEGYLEKLRQAREQDMLLSAIRLAYVEAEHARELQQLARAQEDPWFLLMAEEASIQSRLNQGDLEVVPQLEETTVRCDELGLTYRCVLLEQLFQDVERRLNHLPEAMQHGLKALELTRRERLWEHTTYVMLELGQLARLRDQQALSKAWMDEGLLRTPGKCAWKSFTRENNALLAINRLDAAEARRQMDALLPCGEELALTTVGAMVLADLARLAPGPQDARWFAKTLERLRSAAATKPGRRALLTHIEGRFTLARDRAAGEALLRQALAEVAPMPQPNVDARKARTYSYTSLLMAAGRDRDFPLVTQLLAEEQGGTLPERCMLGVSVDDVRTLAVFRDPEGHLRGYYDESRKLPLGEDLSGLLPEAFIQHLRTCESVAVVARPPLHGRAGLLPPEMAWRYHVLRPQQVPPARLPPFQLVVANVDAPAKLGLASLSPWNEVPREGLLLDGSQATPSRVLKEMERATEIEIHAHGLVDLDSSEASLLVLSPESDGRYALTVRDLRERHLMGSPLVILAACRAAHTGPMLYEPFSLPAAFIAAGARTVLAATVDVPDAEADPFFKAVRERITAGQSPALALRDVRGEWLARDPKSWVRAVLVFD